MFDSFWCIIVAFITKKLRWIEIFLNVLNFIWMKFQVIFFKSYNFNFIKKLLRCTQLDVLILWFKFFTSLFITFITLIMTHQLPTFLKEFILRSSDNIYKAKQTIKIVRSSGITKLYQNIFFLFLMFNSISNSATFKNILNKCKIHQYFFYWAMFLQ